MRLPILAAAAAVGAFQSSNGATVAGVTTLDPTSIGSAGAGTGAAVGVPLDSKTARHSGATEAGSAAHSARISSTSQALGPRSRESSVVATGRVYDHRRAAAGEAIRPSRAG